LAAGLRGYYPFRAIAARAGTGDDRGKGSVTRVRVSDSSLVDDLVGFLDREPDLLAERVAPDEIEASVVSSLHHERLREHLVGHLRAWEETHPGVEARIVD
jgi:hypothetical protein